MIIGFVKWNLLKFRLPTWGSQVDFWGCKWVSGVKWLLKPFFLTFRTTFKQHTNGTLSESSSPQVWYCHPTWFSSIESHLNFWCHHYKILRKLWLENEISRDRFWRKNIWCWTWVSSTVLRFDLWSIKLSYKKQPAS